MVEKRLKNAPVRLQGPIFGGYRALERAVLHQSMGDSSRVFVGPPPGVASTWILPWHRQGVGTLVEKGLKNAPMRLQGPIFGGYRALERAVLH